MENVKNVNWNKIKSIFDNAKITKSSKKKPATYEIVTSFDIETTSYSSNNEDMAFMYIWQFSIENYVIYGRTWEEYFDFIDNLQKVGNVNSKKNLIIWVHNLSFEFQFIRKMVEWKKVFATDERKVVYGVTSQGFIYRDSYILAGYSLNLVAKNLHNHKLKKLVGYLDYSKTRTPETPMTEKELEYSSNDVVIVVDYIHEQIDEYGSITKIPLTNTGRVREFTRDYVFYNHKKDHRKTGGTYGRYRRLMNILTIDKGTYQQAKRAFQGGFTHANANKQGQVIDNVSSFDFTSSYPTVMVAEKFPMSKPYYPKIKSVKALDELAKKSAFMVDIRFTDLQSKIDFENYLSVSRCKVSNDCIEDNGRIYSASKVTTTITDIDWWIVKRCYSWGKIEIGTIRAFYRDYLPKNFIRAIADLYHNKTKLKGVPEKHGEYMRSKGMLNSMYGMSVTDIVRDESVYDGDEWSTEKADIEKQLDDYNKKRNRFSYYLWGVWVTAYARRNLWLGILSCKNDYCYSDTDSIKIENGKKHLPFVKRYNKWIVSKIDATCEFYHLDPKLFHPLTIKGVKKQLGVWDYEGVYTKFKTLGAKRYLVLQDGKLALTCAGLPKKSGLEYMKKQGKTIKGTFDYFSNEMYVPSDYTGKNTHIYIDDSKTMLVTDYLGNTMEVHSPSGVFLYGADFTLSISDQYLEFINMMVKGYQFKGYKTND